VKAIATAVFVCLSLGLRAQTSDRPPNVLVAAGHCLVAAEGDWLSIGHDNPSQVELGMFTPRKEDPSRGSTLYVVEYTDLLHTSGFVFAFVSHGKDPHRDLLLRYRAEFRQSGSGSRQVSLVDPPLGGIATHDEILAAIQDVEWRTWRVPLADLKSQAGAACYTADALM
jgi:hypothetical protein